MFSTRPGPANAPFLVSKVKAWLRLPPPIGIPAFPELKIMEDKRKEGRAGREEAAAGSGSASMNWPTAASSKPRPGLGATIGGSREWSCRERAWGWGQSPAADFLRDKVYRIERFGFPLGKGGLGHPGHTHTPAPSLPVSSSPPQRFHFYFGKMQNNKASGRGWKFTEGSCWFVDSEHKCPGTTISNPAFS